MIKKNPLLISTIEKKLFYLIIFFIPFTFVREIEMLRELKFDLSARVSLAAIFIFILGKMLSPRIFKVKDYSYKIFLVFIGWIFVTFIFNFNEIIHNFYKDKAGISRFVSQFSLLFIFGFFLVFYFIGVMRKYPVNDLFIKVRKTVTYSFWIVCVYALIEYLYGIRNVEVLRPLYEFCKIITWRPINYGSNAWRLGRITSICEEPPFLAIYLVFAGPWLYSYILSHKKLTKFIPTILVIVLTYLSGSRTALLIINFQLVYFLFISYRAKGFKSKITRTLEITIILSIIITVLFGGKISSVISEKINSIEGDKDNQHNVSNITRWGTQIAALKVCKENPYFGVGLGQQGYHIINHYPEWSKKSWEIREKHMNPNIKSWPPGFNLYTRLLAELGIIGAILFALFNVVLMLNVYKKTRHVSHFNKIILITSFISLIGFNINSLQFDSFRLIGYWLNVAFAIYCLKYIKNEQNSSTTNTL